MRSHVACWGSLGRIVELLCVVCLVFLDVLLSGVTDQPVLNFELSFYC